eukprot:m.161780 g.161780  ORF g.161780 m.161780 type:complete len:164 (-) comp15198_c4_seq10:124-615(-)
MFALIDQKFSAMTPLRLLWFALVASTAAQIIDEPSLSAENGTISFVSVRDVAFHLLDNFSGTPIFSTSVTNLKQSIDTNSLTISAVSSALSNTNGYTSVLSSAIATLEGSTAPALSSATATVASNGAAAKLLLEQTQTAVGLNLFLFFFSIFLVIFVSIHGSQ